MKLAVFVYSFHENLHFDLPVWLFSSRHNTAFNFSAEVMVLMKPGGIQGYAVYPKAYSERGGIEEQASF